MLRIRPHQDIKHTLLVSHLGALVTAHGDRHAADALYYCLDFGLDCGLALDEISFGALVCGKGDESELTSTRLVAAQVGWAHMRDPGIVDSEQDLGEIEVLHSSY